MSNVHLYCAASIASLLCFSLGNSLTWTSPVLPKLLGTIPESSPFEQPITRLQESWITALFGLGGIFGPILPGVFGAKIGRKKIMILSSIFIFISYCLIAFAPNIKYMYLARFILGLSYGSVAVVTPIYLAEIAKDTNRGSVTLTLNNMLNMGALMCYVIGPYVSVKILSLICLIPVAIFMLGVGFFVPESPHYLALKQNEDKVVKSLSKLSRGRTEVAQKEAQLIMQFVDNLNVAKLSDLIGVKSIRKGLIIVLFLVVFHQMSGNIAVVMFMQSIFMETGSKIPADLSPIIIGIIQLLSIVLTSLLINKLDRRLLLSTSAFLCFVSLFVLGGYFYCKENSYNVSGVFWLPLASLISFTIFFRLGLGPLPFIMMAELFPTNVKSLAVVVVTISSNSCVFLVSLLFPILSKLGMAFLFWFFAATCVVCFVFVLVFVPETRGKSFQEIQNILNKSASEEKQKSENC